MKLSPSAILCSSFQITCKCQMLELEFFFFYVCDLSVRIYFRAFSLCLGVKTYSFTINCCHYSLILKVMLIYSLKNSYTYTRYLDHIQFHYSPQLLPGQPITSTFWLSPSFYNFIFLTPESQLVCMSMRLFTYS